METITRSPAQVINHHLEAVQNRDLKANMVDYHEDAILILGTDVYKGKDAIQEFFRYVFEAIFTEGFTIDIQQQVIEDNIIYIVWKASSSTFNIPQASDTFLIQDGLIVRQTAFAIMNPV